MEHPDITAALRTGYPSGHEEPKPYYCPICEREAEYIFKEEIGNAIVGCDRCLRKISTDDIED